MVFSLDIPIWLAIYLDRNNAPDLSIIHSEIHLTTLKTTNTHLYSLMSTATEFFNKMVFSHFGLMVTFYSAKSFLCDVAIPCRVSFINPMKGSFVFYSVRYKWLTKMLVLVGNYFIQTCNCSLGPPKALSGTQNT